MNNEIMEALLELGLTAIDWVSATRFAELTGIEETKLTHRRKTWPQDIVWAKQDGSIYYSMKGYNTWLTEQATSRYQRACGSEMAQSKLTSVTTKTESTSRSRTRPLRRVLAQPLKLEAI